MANSFLSFLYGKKSAVAKADLPDKTKELLNLLIEDIITNYKAIHPNLIGRVNLKAWKGKSGMKILRFPKVFHVIEHRKKDPDSKPQEVKTVINLEAFNKVIKILSLIPKKKPIKIRDFSEKYCKEYGMLEFFNEDKFDYSRLFGTRNIYLKKIYYPLKIAKFYGLVNYTKTGWLTRIEDKLEIQGEFEKWEE